MAGGADTQEYCSPHCPSRLPRWDGVSPIGGIVTYRLPDSSPGVSIIGRVWPTVMDDDTETTDPPYTISDVTQDLTGVTTVEVWVDLTVGVVADMSDVPGSSNDEACPPAR